MCRISKAEQIAINKAVGASFEDACLTQLRSTFGPNAVFNRSVEIIFDTSSGDYLIADAVLVVSGVPQLIVEMKSSETASFTPNQRKGYPIIAKHGGILKADNSPFPAIKTVVMYPNTIDPTKIPKLDL